VAFIYARGRRLYCKVKSASNQWKPQPTPFDVGDETKALEWARRLQAEIDRNRPTAGTVADYCAEWMEARRRRGLSSFGDDLGRINNHVLPHFGTMRIAEVRPMHFRDFVRKLQEGELAPRTVHNIVGITRTMFEDAVIDERIPTNPCKAKAGEMPEKVDADPTWRSNATYTTAEVRMLLSDTRVPPGRRVINALKSLAALRHGEAAGLRIRSYNRETPILRRLTISTSYNQGRTKTNVTRLVPVHPTLATIIDVWLADHWERVYGRPWTDDDLLVPTLDFKPLTANYAGVAFREDLARLELRTTAGVRRGRGGHDLRAWSITALQEAGANREIVMSWTHTKKVDVVSGYTRFSWEALCREMLKLDFAIAGYAMRLVPAMFRTTSAPVSPTTNRLLTGDPDGIRTRFSGPPRSLLSPQVAGTSNAEVATSAAVLPPDGTWHVPLESALLGPIRDFVLVADGIALIDRLTNRAKGRAG